jgi:hypothetical protein
MAKERGLTISVVGAHLLRWEKHPQVVSAGGMTESQGHQVSLCLLLLVRERVGIRVEVGDSLCHGV